ncbi:MAG: hypothetical protein V3T56_07585 [Gemmatimonadales bacterium]
MNRFVRSCVRLFCLPTRHEELLGDLVELQLRAHSLSRARRWIDVVSVLLYQCRVRAWRAREWNRVVMVGALFVTALGAAPIAASRFAPYSIDGADAAGVFSLELKGRRVVSATMDGLSFPLERIETYGNTLVFRTADPAQVLEIELTPTGGIEWEGRDGRIAREQDTPIPLEWARQYFAEVERASRADGRRLWGVDLYGPIMFVDRATRFISANQQDSSRILTERDGVWVGTLPSDQNIANTALQWSGTRWTMVAWPVPSSRYARQQLVFHEMFHRIQPELDLPMADAINDHLALRDGRIWLRLEWRALAEALVRDRAARRSAIEDALAFRARRHALFPEAKANEASLEMHEGLAEYTGLVMSGLPASVVADRAAVELGRRESQENFARSFAYASGPAYGILLDWIDPDWRGGLTVESDFGTLLSRAMELQVSQAGAESRGVRYDGARIIAQEQARADRAVAVQAELRSRFLESPTVRLTPDATFRYSFDPNGASPLQGAGTVYDAARITDEWGILDVTSGGVLFLRPDNSIVEVAVPLTGGGDTPPVSGEGWTLELADGWKLARGDGGSWVVRRVR